jgi:hypothetical protein
MKARRIGSALVALLALLVLQTEAVWAGQCAPMTPAPEATARTADCDQAPPAHSGLDSPTERHPRAPVDCPLLAFAGGSCVPASLPAAESQALVGVAPGRAPWVHRVFTGQVIASGPFHPPRL